MPMIASRMSPALVINSLVDSTYLVKYLHIAAADVTISCPKLYNGTGQVRSILHVELVKYRCRPITN